MKKISLPLGTRYGVTSPQAGPLFFPSPVVPACHGVEEKRIILHPREQVPA